MPKALVLTRDLAAPPETVWRLLTDLDGAPRRARGARHIERVAGPDGRVDGGYRVGTRWRETRRALGRPVRRRLTVTAVEPGRSATVEAEAEARGTRTRTSFRLAPARGGGTTLTVEFRAHPATPLGLPRSVLLDLVGGAGIVAARRAALDDLDDLVRAAEAEADRGSAPR